MNSVIEVMFSRILGDIERHLDKQVPKSGEPSERIPPESAFGRVLISTEY